MGEILRAIRCPNCNGIIKLDFDNIINYCPYCASQLTINTSLVKDILIEKEKTKQILGRAELQFQEKKLEAKKESLHMLFWVIFIIVSFILMILGGLLEAL